MSPIDERLKSLNIVLPDVLPPVVDGYVPAFAPFTRSGDQIHLSGRLGKEGRKLLCGKVGDEISLDQGKNEMHAHGPGLVPPDSDTPYHSVPRLNLSECV
jgi:hypothetical protein